MTHLIATGLSYKSAPVELRERLAVPDSKHAHVLGELKARSGLHEVMVVSTCNRVEIYGVGAPVHPHEAQLVLAELGGLLGVDAQDLSGHVFAEVADDAARHIFRVAASLESMVVGEPQILGQVKDAFFKAQGHGVVGPVLDRCLSLAFKSAKRVRTETEISRGAASVPSVAVELALSIFGDLKDSKVLIVGAGEMAEQSAVHLRAAGADQMVVVNRSAERGRTLAEKIGGHYERWEGLASQLQRADVVVTSTGSSLPIIDRTMLKPVLRARRQRPVFFVDIAVPRDVDPDVNKMDHVFLYNVDDLQGIVHDNMRSRHGEASLAAALVEEEVAAFVRWMRSRSIGPLMGQLQAYGREVVDAELQRVAGRLSGLGDDQRKVVEQFGRSIMQKLLHRPMANVRKATGESIGPFDGPALAQALAALFQLPEGAAAPKPAKPEKKPKERASKPTIPRPEAS